MRPSTLLPPLLCITGLTLAAASAHAEQPATTADAKGDGAIETLLITAQRRAQTEIEVPISVSAFSGEALERAQLADLSSLQQVVSGFTMTFAGAHAQPTIRGVGTQVAGVGLPPNVAIYVDGVYRPNAITNNVAFQDIASVEVLKGPQGTLYGQNATGGAMLVTTKGPTSEPQADIRVSYRSENETRFSVFGAGPLTEHFGASLSVYGSHGDGYYENIAPGVKERQFNIWGVRAKGRYTPTDDITLTVQFEHADIYQPYTFAFTNYRRQSVGSFVEGGIVAGDPREYSNDYRPKFDSRATGIFLTAEFDLHWATLTSVTGSERQQNYSGYDIDGSTVEIQHVDFPGKERTLTQSLDLTSNADGPLQWVAGAYFYKDKGYQSLSLKSPPGPFDAITGYVETQSYALYGDLTYEALPGLFITAGLRYSQDDLELHAEAPPNSPTPIEADTSFDDLTPRIVLRYELTDESSIYASFNQGYKTGGYNMLAAATVPVDPEKIKAYEFGYKAALGIADIQAAVFYSKYSDLQVSAYQGSVTTLVNAAEAKIYGAEFQIGLEPLDGLHVDAAFSYVHGEYEDFPGAPHYAWNDETGIAVFPDDASKNPIVNAPKYSGRLGIDYVTPIGYGTLEANANYHYQSTAYFDAFQETKQSGYGVVNASLAWVSPDEDWKVQAFVENLTDEDYVRSIFQQPVTFSELYMPGRTFGIELQVHM